MGPSLSLAAYRAFVRRGSSPDYIPDHARPQGELLWAHATSPTLLTALIELGERLAALRGDLQTLITYDLAMLPAAQIKRTKSICGTCRVQALPSDHPAAVDTFLNHWSPDICLWSGGYLQPNLILETATRNIPMLLVDATETGFDSRKERWFPEVSRRLLAGFSTYLARSAAARKKLIQLGVASEDIRVTPPLQPGGQMLPCDFAEFDKMSAHLAGRPVWLAADVLPEEVDQVLRAHRLAARKAHRLLLVLAPATGSPDLASRVGAQGFRVANWAQGILPDDLTQVLVADSPGELGLWYRIAPLAFVGNSLVTGCGGRDPFAAAALGAAILYGPNVGDHLDAYSRLASAGAARIVKDANSLGTAVLHLSAPDLAASMAHAGWEVVTQGAEVTDRIINLVQGALDMGEAA